MRRLIADAIESLILLLDEIDGDAEHEQDAAFEGELDMEPSLGATHSMDQSAADGLSSPRHANHSRLVRVA